MNEKKPKFTLQQVMKYQSGSTGIGLLFLYPWILIGIGGKPPVFPGVYINEAGLPK